MVYWVDACRRHMCQQARYDVTEAYSLSIDWLADLSPEQVERHRHLLEKAYTATSMWAAFHENRQAGVPVLVFSLVHKPSGRLLGTRSIGEVTFGPESWGNAALSIGQKTPVGGSSFTVDWPLRHQGLGSRFFDVTNDWFRRASGLGALFGDTCSRKALQMYALKGALLHEGDVKNLCAAYHVPDIQTFFTQYPSLERLPDELGVLYVWCFDGDVADKLGAAGYRPAAFR